jgi:carboxypeptidase family protein
MVRQRAFAFVRTACFVTAGLALAVVTPAAAQVHIAGAIAGTVIDSSGGVVPGARVQLVDEGTGIQREATTTESGTFLFPDLSFGSYRVTVALDGFQTAIFSNVRVESSRTTDLRVKLQPGALSEEVQVRGVTPVLEVTSNVISATVTKKDMDTLPLNGRSTMNFARLIPGSVAPTGTGSTHYNGMPGGTINPTIDGINNASNGFKSGGTSFFSTVQPRLGAMEEVTVETAGLGADAGAEGGVSLKFITRRGTNQYHGTIFEQNRNDVFNANSYFNSSRGLAKAKVRQNEFGGGLGGPVPIGSLKQRLFFFANYEEQYIPGTATQSNTVLTSEAQQGIFRYQTATGEQRTANLLQIAATSGFPSAFDPNIQALLAKQAQAFGSGNLLSTNDLRMQSFSWLEPSKNIFWFPTTRLDLQITPSLAWMGSWNLQGENNHGRRQWPLPDIPVQFQFHESYWITSTGLNWTIGSRNFNEFRYGVQHSGDTTPGRGVEFYAPNGSLNGKFLRLNFPVPFNNLTTMVQDAAPITGRHYITTIYDTLTLLRGNHSFKLGGTYRLTDWHDTSYDGPGGILQLPAYSIGSPTGDPVQSIFNTTTMPGIQSADLASVYSLYALMTGRLTRIRTARVVNPNTLQYDIVDRENWTSSKMGGVFAQDTWRMKPNFTLNYGLRWEFATAPYNHLGIAVFPDYANFLGPSTALFQPGKLDGVQNPVMKPGKVASKGDMVNPGPNVGFTWTPNVESGLLHRLIGNAGKTVIRGGYALTYYDEGTNFFMSNPGNNPGQQQSLDLQPGAPGFSPGGLTLQSALPPYVAFPDAYKSAFALADFTFSGSAISTMKPDLKTPYVQSWNIGVQREIAPNTVVEARYLGNRGSHLWRTYNLNEVNVLENGFLDEFKKAQANLAINTANGRTGFANNGLPGQSPLPIFETAFGARGSQAALAAGSGFTNGTFVTNLQQGTVGSLAGSLANNSQYLCRMLGSSFGPCARLGFDASGPYPINFFQVNPYVAGANLNLVDDQSWSKYQGLQLQLRRRFSNGFSLTANYTLAKNTTDIWADNATQTVNYRSLRNRDLDGGPAPFDVRHVFQAFWTYELPFGTNHRMKSGNAVADAIIGGWTFSGVLSLQSGNPFRLTSGRNVVNNLGDGGVILAGGMTVDKLQDLISISPAPGFNRYWIDPKLVGPDGRANADFLQVPTTPGQAGQYIYLYGRNSYSVDASLSKMVPLPRRASLTIWFGAFNVFNNPIWSAPTFLSDTSIQSATFGQTTGPVNASRSMQVRGEIRF